MSHVTTHVLDTARGRPAVGVPVRLLGPDGTVLGSGATDADGRVRSLGPAALGPGTHTLVFGTGAWYAALDVDTFYPEVTVAFAVVAPADGGPAHLHVPLLLSPYAFSTYRGS
ncbi:hydroxyisourate hydrolase [Cellulomonas endophytica]|uniref:hydroxyisourate hydrolase n=1 Tax=Cellulomonas endophytica TaxID=2494735 RepID=UPI00196B57FA|nr:hydroxyisourate hydrolase [Cellulomonas endophytica]